MERPLIPNPVIWVVGDVIGSWYFSHSKLNTLFGQAGAPGEPPLGNCVEKSQNWLFRINKDPSLDAVRFLGDLLCPFMSLDLKDNDQWVNGRQRIVDALATAGYAYRETGVISCTKSEEVCSTEFTAHPSLSAISSPSDFTSRRFRIALSFPGEKRAYVEDVANNLSRGLGIGEVFYDLWFQAHLARPNLDLVLQELYLNKSDLVVVFLCHAYEQKDWPWIEWKAIRQLLKQRRDDSVMFIRFDHAPIPGTFPTDGFIDANSYSPAETAGFILERIQGSKCSTQTSRPKAQERILPNDRSDRPRLVFSLPRGLIVVENIKPEGTAWTMVASYYDFEEGWKRATHYHPSYARRWEEDRALEKQCLKVGLPRSDWTYARWSFYMLTQVGEAVTYEDVKRIVADNSGVDRTMKVIESGQSIYPDHFVNDYPNLLKTHGLRDLLCEIEELLDSKTERWGSLHEITFSLRLRTTTELARLFENPHPSHALITTLLNQHDNKRTEEELLQWLRLVNVALIDTVAMLKRGK